MIYKMRKIMLLFLVISTTFTLAQKNDDYEKQKMEFEKKMKEQQEERIQDFVTQLQADDFQKEIIKQKIHSYYIEKKAIYSNLALKYFEREEQLTSLDNTYFSDIKDMISEDIMTQIQSFIKDNITALKKEKKKKKKNKNE